MKRLVRFIYFVVVPVLHCFSSPVFFLVFYNLVFLINNRKDSETTDFSRKLMKTYKIILFLLG